MRLHGRHLLLLAGQIEEGLSVTPTHIRNLGIVRHLDVRPVRSERRRGGFPLTT